MFSLLDFFRLWKTVSVTDKYVHVTNINFKLFNLSRSCTTFKNIVDNITFLNKNISKITTKSKK